MLKIFRYLKGKDWAFIAASVVFIVAQVWLDLKMPDYMKQITLLVQTPGSAMADIWIQGGWMLLCALGSLASSVVVGFFASRVAANFSKNLRAATFRKVEGFSMEEVNGFFHRVSHHPFHQRHHADSDDHRDGVAGFD